MKRHILSLLACSVLAAQPAFAAGRVEVQYLEPEQFSDIGRSVIEREQVMAELTRYIDRQLAPQLAAGQTLRIAFTDIDLAGEQRFGRLHDIRVLRGGADWPRLALNYTLLDGSRTVRQGSVKLSDPSYMFSGTRALESTSLGYEKRLLARWFDETFR